MNFYEVLASNVTGGNVALGCAASALSWNAAGCAAYRGVDGLIGEVSYYNSNGVTNAEFWQADLGSGSCATQAASSAGAAIFNVTFVNRAPMVGIGMTAISRAAAHPIDRESTASSLLPPPRR
jgi:hypothetical protein